MTLTPVAARLAPILRMLRSSQAGGVLLMLASVVALIWANSPLAAQYTGLLHWRPLPSVNGLELHAWVNDGLMAVFFLMVGLELRREMTRGELASMKRLAAPGMAALGGMIVPALIYIAFNWSDPQQMRGWAVPVATDIAFALAVLGMLGARVPIGLKVFLTALAIIDDLGAILVIALFYSGALDLQALGGAAVLLLGLFALSRSGVRSMWPYLLGGAVLWALVFRSGIHATLAGVALAFVVPMGDANGRPAIAERLEHGIAPVVAFLVLPVFGLTNAGLSFGALPESPWTDPVAAGVTLGLLLGKQFGVFGGLLAATKLGLARLPAGATLTQLYGAAVLCGIGFTMSLFIGELAFRNTPHGDEVKLAVFVGSVLSALLGLAVLAFAPRRAAPAAE